VTAAARVPVAVDPSPADLARGLDELAAQARAGTGPLTLVAADLVAHPQAVADLTEDPRPGTAVLTSRSGRADLRVRNARVRAVRTAVHPADGATEVFTGVLRVDPDDREAAATAATELAALARRDGWQPVAGEAADPLALLVLGLVRTGVPVRTVTLDPWPWARAGDPGSDDVRRRLAELSPHQVHVARLARATKADDGFVATFLSRPVARLLTPMALRLGLTPNGVTLVSVLLGLLAAGAFATGSWPWLVVGAVLLQLSLVVDCVDGDVARYRRAFTPTGAWLDASTDRLKEFACYGGLAWGAGTGRTAWVLASVMLTVQTVRHAMDYTFTAVRELREDTVEVLPLDRTDDTGHVDAARRRGRPAAVVWAKKLLHLGIGERWLVLSVLAAADRPQLALVTLLVLAAVSACYVSAGRLLRTAAWRPDPVAAREREIVAAQVDAAPLVPPRWVDRLAGLPGGSARYGWLRPAYLRALEYAAVLALTAALPGAGAGAAVFVLLLVVASHHYDLLYRVLQGLRVGGAAVLGLGWPGRLLVVAALAVVGAKDSDAARAGLWLVAGALGVLFLVVEPAGVLRAMRSQPVAGLPPEGATGG
jgi:phosphatidylglycerophosphate synthase